MKQAFAALLLALCLVTGQAGSSFGANAGEVIVYNWSEYIPQDVLENFTRETGIKVVYSTYESNEAMYAKLKLLRGGSYDVVVPSSYFIKLMTADGLLSELDHNKLPGINNIDPKLMNQSYDPGNKYSIPYMWSSVGIMYNKKYVNAEHVKTWKDLLRPEFKGKLMLSDDVRDTMGVALKALGHSANSKDEEEIKEAYEFLVKLLPSVRVFDITATKQAFVAEEVVVGMSWGGDAVVAQQENPDLVYVYPEEGALVWIDNLAITSNGPNKENAYAFINYMLKPEVALRCMQEYHYSTPNVETLKLLDEKNRQNPAINPTARDLMYSEVLDFVGQAQTYYNTLWERLKTQL